MKSYLKIAIQKSGRLNKESAALLEKCGIGIQNGGQKLKAQAANFPLEILYLRDDDIPQYVAEGIADLGIVGRDTVWEKGKNTEELLPLGFGQCHLSLAVPDEVRYPGLEWFENKKIATSFPHILRDFLEAHQINASIEEINGSVEIAPHIGLADAICDLVSTGSTLLKHGLREVHSLLNSESVLISNRNPNDSTRELTSMLVFRIKALLNAQKSKYILLNAPNSALPTIKNLLPGMKSPTVLPLAEENWSSIHSVVAEDEFWKIIGQLKENGAQGILVAPIEKMIL